MEEKEFQRLALNELPAVFRLAYHLAAKRHEVDDLVQETYLHALKASATFQLADHGMRPWLFKILRNVINEHYGKQQREAKLAVNAHEPVADDGQPGISEVPSLAEVNWDQVDERLKHAIDELPLNLKTVFLLSAVEGLRYREIAEVIGAPVGTVMSRLFRAREMLSVRLATLAGEQGLVRREEVSNDEMKPRT
ncbi:MAG: sigma-70 family RNA polymerase sigma factor [Burkholderiales bacterium]|nr:sigma-70 family RNA polymerase sigma factor [Phycisphaerae bacterium]